MFPAKRPASHKSERYSVMTEMSEFAENCSRIEAHILAGSTRGIYRLFPFFLGNLAKAAVSLAENKHDRIIIVTGFFIPGEHISMPETDGPIGAVHLAKVLHEAGKQVSFLTDSRCVEAVHTAMVSNGLMLAIHVADSVSDVETLIKTWTTEDDAPTHLISIERAGPDCSGVVRNMKGVDISQYTPPLHLLFEVPPENRPYKTICVGDGGNEIGMGNIPRHKIAENIDLGDQIQCRTSCDFLIGSTISNWGAGALAAAFCLKTGDMAASLAGNYNIAADRMILNALFDNKHAVDGVSGTFTNATVDGIPQIQGEEVIKNILHTVSLSSM